MDQALHLAGGHLHEKAVALHTADHPLQGLADQGFGLPGLGHGQAVEPQLLDKAGAAIEALDQGLSAGLLVGGELAGGQEGPVDAAVAAVGGQVDPGLVAHRGAVLAFDQEQHQQLLVPEVGVVKGGEAPGG